MYASVFNSFITLHLVLYRGSENHSSLTHSVLFPIVYLRSSPEVCYQRLQHRGRIEEKPVTLVRFDLSPHIRISNKKGVYIYMLVTCDATHTKYGLGFPC